jgi:hypothetical protein
MRSAINLPARSVEPPGAKGTTRVMTRSGKAASASRGEARERGERQAAEQPAVEVASPDHPFTPEVLS